MELRRELLVGGFVKGAWGKRNIDSKKSMRYWIKTFDFVHFKSSSYSILSPVKLFAFFLNGGYG